LRCFFSLPFIQAQSLSHAPSKKRPPSAATPKKKPIENQPAASLATLPRTKPRCLPRTPFVSAERIAKAGTLRSPSHPDSHQILPNTTPPRKKRKIGR